MNDKDKGPLIQHLRLPFRKGTILIACLCVLILCATLTYGLVEGVHRVHADSGSSFNQGVAAVPTRLSSGFSHQVGRLVT